MTKKISFKASVRALVPEEKDKYLALASIDKLAPFLPNIDTKVHRDVLPVAFNACVVNRVNANDDVINTETGLLVAKQFINKFINLEHDRDRVVGVILTSGFSEFGTDKPLTEEEVKDTKKPFNITLGGIIWKSVNQKIAEYIQECSNPDSDDYLKISASWEVGYEEHGYALIKGNSKNLEDAVIVETPSENMDNHLRAYEGTGVTENGARIYRIALKGVLAEGIGLTEHPAADVEGVLTEHCEDVNKDKDNSSANIENNISLSNTDIVIANQKQDMKITSIEQIKDENLKELKASSITEFIQDEISKLSERYAKESTEKDDALKAATEKNKELEKSLEGTKTELGNLKAELEKIRDLMAAREQEEKFNDRMEAFDSIYDLDAEARKVLASQIKDLNDEDFKKFEANIAVLMKNKKKADKPLVASQNTDVDDALENGKPDKQKVPNSSDNDDSLRSKFAKAFEIEQWDINYHDKRKH